MWDACRDSRDTMKKMLSEHVSKDPHSVTTGLGADCQRVVRRFTFQPHQDLFIVNLLVYWTASKQGCSIDTAKSLGRSLMVSDLDHVAFDIDPVYWQGDFGYRIWTWPLRNILEIALATSHPKTIYLLDYRIRRLKQPGNDSAMDTTVFHGSNGRFIEVTVEDEWGYTEEQPHPFIRGAFLYLGFI